ncbi:MAG TPA: hypothetical protein VK526_10825, partial [Bradyrhizobium sp.]|nr:hypothetical protein [Bradyrhizobium sp.]
EPSPVESTTALGNSGAAGCRLPRERRSQKSVREEHFMPRHLEPKLSILPAAQRQIWIVKSGSLSMLIRVADMRAVSARQK